MVNEKDLATGERPGCVSAYAILMWIAGGIYIIGSFFVAIPTASIPDGGAGIAVFTFVCMGLFAAIPILVGIGLWRMKQWAWWLVVIGQSLGVLGAALNVVFSLLVPDGETASFSIGGSIFGGLLNGAILYWFITNRHYFFGPVYVMGPDGKAIPKPGSQSDNRATTAIVIGVVAIACIIPIVVIAILTLLGPQIGNVFSRIVVGLEA